MVHTIAELVTAARSGQREPVAVPAPRSEETFAALANAMHLGMIRPILIGDRRTIHEALARLELAPASLDIVDADSDDDAARIASSLVRSGEASVLMKGDLKTSALMRAALHPAHGLRTGRIMSDVMVSEIASPTEVRLVAVTDGGMNVAPDLEAKHAIVENAVGLFRGLGFARPNVAILCATEIESAGMPHSADAARLVERWREGRIAGCALAGPMALDGALSPSAAEAKGLAAPVGGHADILVVPTIEAGNLLGKAFRYLASRPSAHVIEGALAPILIPSRTESADDKLGSIALGVLRVRARGDEGLAP